MSYKLLSVREVNEQDIKQWEKRCLENEISGYEYRSIIAYFNKYMNDKYYYIIEAGCGFGGWCQWFQKYGHKVLGIEYNKDVIAKAKYFDDKVPVEFGDVIKLGYESNTFDAYISLGVIEHFEHGADNVLSEAYRILKPNGLIFVSTPYLSNMRRFISHPVRSFYFYIRKLMSKNNFFWEYRFTKKELEDQVKKAGFDIIETVIDDCDESVKHCHIGLYADWFFLRKKGGEMWELNRLGILLLKILNLIPRSWYCSAIMVIARSRKNDESTSVAI